MTVVLERTDEELIARLARGEDEALEALVSRYWERATRLACALVGGDPGAAEDVAQDAFVQLLKAADRFREGASFRPWFFQIVRHVAHKHLRAEGRRRRREEAVSVTEASPSHEGRVEVGEAVRTWLAALEETQREAVSLHVIEGLTHREVAAVQGAPLGTVSQRIRGGLKRLRQQVPATAALSAAPLAAVFHDAFAVSATPPSALALRASASAVEALVDLPTPGLDVAGSSGRAQQSFAKGILVIAVVCAVVGAFTGKAVQKVFFADADSPALWEPEGSGVELPLPDGWDGAVLPGGRQVAVRGSEPGEAAHFLDNVNIMRLPRDGKDLDAIEAENRAALAQAPFQLIGLRRRLVDGREGLELEFWSVQGGNHFAHLAVIFLDGDEQVVVTGTCLRERFERYRADLEAVLSGLRAVTGR